MANALRDVVSSTSANDVRAAVGDAARKVVVGWVRDGEVAFGVRDEVSAQQIATDVVDMALRRVAGDAPPSVEGSFAVSKLAQQQARSANAALAGARDAKSVLIDEATIQVVQIAGDARARSAARITGEPPNVPSSLAVNGSLVRELRHIYEMAYPVAGDTALDLGLTLFLDRIASQHSGAAADPALKVEVAELVNAAKRGATSAGRKP